MALTGTLTLAWARQDAADARVPTPFSQLAPGGDWAADWRVHTLPNQPATRFSRVRDNEITVVRAEADASAATLVSRFRADAHSTVAWRWKVDRTVASADLARKSGDDFAARVYVFFDVPAEDLPLTTRIKYAAVKLFYKVDLPTAALCYVWDHGHPEGHSAWSAYTDRVRVIVLRNKVHANEWQRESRDVAADFKTAFGTDAPAITGVALGSDTDQTKERVVALFGDVVLKPAP
ncbi:MAG: DUF3047 domain-containing protein [Betaproteobacteria bacterium]|nr:DUF3047 domain-containing protein [Betaproteobacteria bacterium]